MNLAKYLLPLIASVCLVVTSNSTAQTPSAAPTSSVKAQNTISFDNQSGEPTLVKLIGPATSEIKVPDGTKQGVQVSVGKYFIEVRYGISGNYHYTKGEEFTVDETATTTSPITITLHKVVNGNYDSSPITEQEFGAGSSANVMTSGNVAPVLKEAVAIVKTKSGKEYAFIDNLHIELHYWGPKRVMDSGITYHMEDADMWNELFNISVDLDDITKVIHCSDVQSLRFDEVNNQACNVTIGLINKSEMRVALKVDLNRIDEDCIHGTEQNEGDIRIPFAKIDTIKILDPSKFSSAEENTNAKILPVIEKVPAK
ncbi:MAG TPA: hypothetical protein VK737_05290 [Opitutales bacterium]|nr:hypothetical protein [Opitutales bacterium]